MLCSTLFLYDKQGRNLPTIADIPADEMNIYISTVAATSGSGFRHNSIASPTGSSFRFALVTGRAPAPWKTINSFYLDNRVLRIDNNLPLRTNHTPIPGPRG